MVDRSFDPLTPLLHDFHYMPMLYDLLDISQNNAEFESIASKKQGKGVANAMMNLIQAKEKKIIK